MTILLSKNNFCEEIIAFNDAQEAVQQLSEKCHDHQLLPDVIFVDLNMPKLDGRQFLDAYMLLPLKKKITIFILTSSTDPSDLELIKKYDIVQDYLMKPITALQLSEVTLLLQN
jgi:CheY-like chemotaxis protein